jgi:hypothetical protein
MLMREKRAVFTTARSTLNSARQPLRQLLSDDAQSGFQLMNCQRDNEPRIPPIANRTSATSKRREQGNDVT